MKSKTKRILILIIVLVLISVFAVYGYSTHYYKTHFHPHTYVNDIKIGGKTLSEAEELLKTNSETYEILITDKYGKTESINEKEIDYMKDFNKEIKDILNNQDSFLKIFKEDKYTIDFKSSYNKEKLKEAVNDLTFLSKNSPIFYKWEMNC